MALLKNDTIDGYKGKFKFKGFTEDNKKVIISYNGRYPQEFEVLYDNKGKQYFLFNELEKIYIK